MRIVTCPGKLPIMVGAGPRPVLIGQPAHAAALHAAGVTVRPIDATNYGVLYTWAKS